MGDTYEVKTWDQWEGDKTVWRGNDLMDAVAEMQKEKEKGFLVIKLVWRP